MRPVPALLIAILLAAPLAAQDPDMPAEDAEGCRDSTLLSRMPGCRILGCEAKDFDAQPIHVGNDGEEARMEDVEGQVEVLTWVCPSRLSGLQLVRNAEGALKAAGYAPVFSGRYGGEPTVTLKKAGTQVWVRSEPWNDLSGYVMTAVRAQAMAQEMTAGAMAAEIAKGGRVAVYGVEFDTGQATLRPESDAVLGQIVALLKANPTWKVHVEGHTDNVGGPAANQALSEKRAAAVVAWLGGHGIAAARLSAQGFGDTRPVGDNATEAGRAKNRRVELVKR